MLVLFAAAASAVLLAAYGVRVAVLGRYRHERARREPGSFFLGRFLIEFGYWCFSPLERAALALGITPNQLTVASLGCSIAGAAAFAVGRPEAGGGLVILCAILDALDGMVARSRGTASEAGELIDAAVDRYAEIATFAGIAAYYRTYPLGFWLAIVSLGGALLVSYARAKGEINGIDARMGAMNRGERAMYIGIAGLLSPLFAHVVEPGAIHPAYHLLLVTLALVAVVANVTALRRFLYIHRELRKRDELPAASGAGDPLTGWMGRAWTASAIATVVDYGTFTVLVELASVYTGTSRALGALLGAITNFTVNKVWTFRTQGDSVWHEVPRYAAISLTSLLLNTLGVVLLTDGLHWNPLVAAGLVGVLVAVGWNLPLHRYFVFRHGTHRSRPGLALIGAVASASAAVAVLFVAYGMPFAEESVHGFSTQADDSGKVTQTSYLPKLLPEAFYSESYSFLFQADDGSFARVQFLVSNAGLEGHGGAAARAVLVTPGGKTIEDAEAFESGQWRVLREGAIEMGANSLTMGPDASHHLHFAGKKLVFDATVTPQTKALRPGGGRVTFDAGGRAVFDQTIFALRSKFDGTVWSSDRGGRRLRGDCYADTSYSTVPAYKSASLWYRMEAFDESDDGAAALAVLIPPQGSRAPAQGWLYTTKGDHPEVRSSEVKLSFEQPRRETGGRFEYDVPQRVQAVALGARGEKITVSIEAKRLLYKEDVLGEMGPLSRFLVSIMAAPMTYTYENHYELRIDRPGAPVERRAGTAVSEFAYANAPKQIAQF
ncbi:MAG TPA: GtrA family protein [Myxococcales bacterium]|jgi:phosphatidylglycerophosphate synthase/putative flippase GtrA|nr:GtrA family protein [Myxococcales bacterium]